MSILSILFYIIILYYQTISLSSSGIFQPADPSRGPESALLTTWDLHELLPVVRLEKRNLSHGRRWQKHPGAWFTARVFCHVLKSLYDDLHVYIMVFAGLVKQSSSFLVTKCGKFHCVLFFHHFSLVQGLDKVMPKSLLSLSPLVNATSSHA